MNSKLKTISIRCVFLLVACGWIVTPAQADNPAVLHSATNLPIPCSGGCGAANAAWTNAANVASWSYGGGNTAKMIVTQQTDKAILNWQSFNIGKNNAVQFVQPNATSQVLNRIHGADPTAIAGKLSANGQVYLLNQNGIVFKDGAQINVGGLVASTLNMTDDVFYGGLLSALDRTPAFEGGIGDIAVERGAHLQTGPGGRVMLIAPNVMNEGLIETPDGQTILAAGAKAYVASGQDFNSDVKINGLVVEVDGGGKAVNLGDISVGKGDAELVGLAVQQLGRITAKTSVSANGTIRLLARDTVGSSAQLSSGFFPVATKGGDLVLGSGSRTEVLPDIEDKTTSVDEQAFTKLDGAFVKDSDGLRVRTIVSKIQLRGKNVDLESNSSVVAPSGEVYVQASLNQGPGAAQAFGSTAEQDPADGAGGLVGIHLGKNSVIDVSGTTTTVLQMSRNVVDLELRANELADSPTQRDGVLRGENVSVDIRSVDPSGHIPIADVSGAIALIGKSVEERSAVGGTITLNSHGETTSAPGSRLAVSGGSVRYEGGSIATTKVLSGNRVFDISKAPADLVYDGILGDDAVKSEKWHTVTGGSGSKGAFEAGYAEGADAGRINLVAPIFHWDGDLKGSRATGLYQRELSKLPMAGRLTIGRSAAEFEVLPNFVTQSVRLEARANATDSVNRFNTEMLSRSGLGNISIYSNGEISLSQGAPLVLPTGGALRLQARQISLASNVTVSGGTVDALSRVTVSSTAEGRRDVSVAPGVHISTAGNWTNDLPIFAGDSTSVVNVNGGAISLTAANDLLLAEGSVLDVQSGAWLRSDGSPKYGKGGTIALATKDVSSRLLLNGQLLGFGFGVGGSLNLTTTRVDVVAQSPAGSDHLAFAPDFFSANGFSAFKISANAGDLSIAEGLVLAPQMRTRQLRSDYRRFESGAGLDGVGYIGVLPDDLRAPVNLSFAATSAATGTLSVDNYGRLLLGSGAKILGEPGAVVSLASNYQLQVLGEIYAPAGKISLDLGQFPADPNYIPQQGLWLGASSVLAAPGIERLLRNGLNSVRSVEDAGSISLSSKGYLMVEPGARLDVSAIKGTSDQVLRVGSLPQGVVTVGRAGRIGVAAWEAAFLDGDFLARAADTRTPGGEFEFNFGRGIDFAPPSGIVTFPSAVRQLELRPSALNSPFLSELGKLPAEFNGVARVDVAKISAGGFDSVALHSDDLIAVKSDLAWQVPGSLTLDAHSLDLSNGVVASIGGNYLRVGNDVSKLDRQQIKVDAQTGNGKLSLHGQWVELIGNFVADHVGAMTLIADHDLRLRGVVVPALDGSVGAVSGMLQLAGDLTISAGRVYPSTLTDFTIKAIGPDSRTIRVDGLNGASGDILSAAGKLTFDAPVIQQFGDVRAPHGTIEFVAKNRLELGPDSTTSVAGGALPVPFGSLENGKNWVYNFPGNILAVQTAPPQKQILLTAPHVALAAGAVIDVSGGGDLTAFEFLKGPGGSIDVLGVTNTYAILPSLGNGFAPFDIQNAIGADYAAMRSLNVSGIPGLADGTYTLLPGHYALLPGAFMVRQVGGSSGPAPGTGVVQSDGSVLIAGRSTRSGSTLLDDKWSTFRISPGSVARQQSEFAEQTASQFFADLPRTGGVGLPADAGSVAISGSRSIQMDGIIRAEHAADARGAQVDIDATNIRIIASGTSTTAGNELLLDAGTIARFGAENLLLGGLRTYSADSVRVSVSAARVVVDPNVVLEGDTITLVASDEIRLEQNSQVRSEGHQQSENQQNWIIGAKSNSDGALLQVSTASNVHVFREGPKRLVGNLLLAQDSAVDGNSVILDVTKTLRVDGRVDAREALDIGVPRLLFGNAPVQTDGSVLPAELTRNWSSLSRLGLRSYSSIDFYGNVDIGSSSLKNLILESPVIQAASSGDAQNVSLTATELTLRGGSEKLGEGEVPAGKTLKIRASRVNLAGGDSLLKGFSLVTFDVATELVATEKGSLRSQGDLILNVPRVATATAVDYDLASTAGLELHGSAQVLDRPEGLGGKLNFTAARLLVDSLIDLPSGYVAMTATGPNGLTVGPLGVIRTAGLHRPLLDGVAFDTPGGEVGLEANLGSLIVDAAAVIDVSGGGVGADAGRVDLKAVRGILQVDGAVNAVAGPGGRGGVANLDALEISGLGQFAQRLSRAGFSDSQSYRVRNGDVLIETGTLVTAGELQFVADNGGLALNGTLDAARRNGGSVRLVAKNDVSVGSGAVIRATASAAEKAGVVELESTAGAVRISEGSRITVGSTDSGGVVRLISTRNSAGQYQISTLPAASFVNVGDLVVVDMIDESSRVPSGGSISSTVQNAIKADLVAFNKGVNAQRLTLGAASLPALRVVPGVRIDVAGNLTIAADWNLAGWRYGDTTSGKGMEAGLLILRAAGNLTFSGSLSDGFETASANNTTGTLGGPSWSYRVVAGADHQAADSMAISAQSIYNASSVAKQTLSINASKRIRTGRGEIRLAAAQDVVLAGTNATLAAIYTAGTPSPQLVGFNPFSTASGVEVSYPEHGGSIEIIAGHDVRSGPTKQLYTGWLIRGDLTKDEGVGAWGISFDDFQQGVGALAGGDVRIAAGNDIAGLSVSVPTVGRSVPSAGVFEVLNSGDLQVSARNDVLSGLFYVGRGALTVRAGGAIQRGTLPTGAIPKDSRRLSGLFAIGQGSVDVRARNAVTIDSVINPTFLVEGSGEKYQPGFFTYNENSSATFLSIAGNVTLLNGPSEIKYYGSNPANNFPIYPGNLGVFAPVGDIAILNKITLMPTSRGELTLWAGHDLIARSDASVSNPGVVMSDADPSLLPSQRSPVIEGEIPAIFKRLGAGGFPKNIHARDPVHFGDSTPVSIVAGNDITGGIYVAKSLRVTAGRDIVNLDVQAQNLAATDVSEINAGRDVAFPTTRKQSGVVEDNKRGIQISGPGKVFVLAGHDVDLGTSAGIVSYGNTLNSGLADIGAEILVYSGLAADYVDWLQRTVQPLTELKDSPPAIGKLLNFVSQRVGRTVVDPVEAWSEFMSMPSVVQRPLVLELIVDKALTGEYVSQVNLMISQVNPKITSGSNAFARSPEVRGLFDFVSQRLDWKQKDIEDVGPSAYWAQHFMVLPAKDQQKIALEFIVDRPIGMRRQAVAWELEDALRAAGIEHNHGGSYDLGWDAIANDFPAHSYFGDIDLYASQIKSADGGSVRLFVPGGLINVGAASNSTNKAASESGIVAQDVGSVVIFSLGDVSVNLSRVFTLKGGDILIWSSAGSIDAGRGAKSAISAPKPIISVSPDGSVTTNYAGAVAGSGIRTIDTSGTDSTSDPKARRPSVDLIAPKGNVNAGDAGIGSVGTLNIAAVQVTGADNIQVSGTSTGVPTTDVGSLSAGFAGQSDASANAAKGVQDSLAESAVENSATPQADRALAYLEVMIQGFGGDEETDSKKD